MKVLLSNDDGIHANGINVLAQTLSAEHEVYIIAPDKERSAASHSLTINNILRVTELDSLDGIKKRWAVSGTPADCIKIGLSTILSEKEMPDLVISGINHGPNLGFDIMYSGTVGCALEAAITGIPAIAVSLYGNHFEKENFAYTAKFTLDFIKQLKDYKFPPKTLININVPSKANEKSDIAFTKIGNQVFGDFYEKKSDPKGKPYYWLAGEILRDTDEKGTDIEAVRNNRISITTITYEMDKTDYIQELEKSITAKKSVK